MLLFKWGYLEYIIFYLDTNKKEMSSQWLSEHNNNTALLETTVMMDLLTHCTFGSKEKSYYLKEGHLYEYPDQMNSIWMGARIILPTRKQHDAPPTKTVLYTGFLRTKRYFRNPDTPRLKVW